ncbi:hypothetical protein [Streptomyces sp. ISL-100]|uniref:hypothetical protein n=1 Tax=Streptomyces sp. ISL-100 TaxID=2819173 RepID=UPI001BEBD148|nr:hypothetical protein [Streptomyces sp. ISL-100]MBT2400633.1 hypothetical protein [Streptomyces sp. ISL-100]
MSDAAPIDGQNTIELPGLDPVELPVPPAADEKPKRRTRRASASSGTDSKPRAPRGGVRRPNLESRIAQGFTTIGTFACIVNEFDGMTIIQGAPNLAASLSKLADENPKVRESLEKMLAAGAWSAVIGAVAAVGIPIAANHKLLPPAVAGLFAAAPPGPEAQSAA